MKKGFSLVLILILGYVAGGAVLHYVVFREGPVPEEMYPRPGTVFESKMEGVQQHILVERDQRYVKRVVVHPHARGPREHIHLGFDEPFHVTEGQLHVLINGQEHIIGPGELVVVPPGTPHKFFNPADSPVVHEPPERPRDFDLFLSQFYRFADEYPPQTHPLDDAPDVTVSPGRVAHHAPDSCTAGAILSH